MHDTIKHKPIMSLLYLIFLDLVLAWDINHLVDEDSIITRLTLHGSRAFLSVPRTPSTNVATLIAAPWPDSSALPAVLTTKAYPLLQRVGRCRELQSVVAVAVDGRRLHVVDAGGEDCGAKTVVFDLWTNQEVTQLELYDVPGSALNDIALFKGRAYISDPGGEALIVHDTLLKRYWWLDIATGPITELAVAPPLLYFTSNVTNHLYSIDVSDIEDLQSEVSPKLIGEKLGRSTALTADNNNGLHYFLSRDCATLRWNAQRKLRAESHDVTMQSCEKLEHVQDIVVDVRGQVWALGSRACVKLDWPLHSGVRWT